MITSVNNKRIPLTLIMRIVLSRQGFMIGKSSIKLNKHNIEKFIVDIIALANGDTNYEKWQWKSAKRIYDFDVCKTLQAWCKNAKDSDTIVFG